MDEKPGRASALLARYGEVDGFPPGPWNPALASIMGHRSVRAYKPDPLPHGTLEMIVAAAQSAATSTNIQSWSVVTVSEPALRADLARMAAGQKHVTECPLFLVFLADLSRAARVGEEAGVTLEALPYLETFLVAAMDAAIAAQNAAVAAESLGLGTVYIGAIRNDPEGVAAALRLPPGAVAVTGLCIGYADSEREQAAVKPRLPQAAVLHRNRYDDADKAARASYDKVLTVSSANSERVSDAWAERVVSRLGTVSALAGRHKLRAALKRLGLPLR